MNENDLLKGERVRLRAYREDDLARAWTAMNEADNGRYLSRGALLPAGYETERRWIASQTAYGGEYNFAIETLDDRAYIGGCGYNHIDMRARCATVGIMIGYPEYRGRGYGTDAMRILLRYAFTHLNLHRVQLFVFGFNPRAARSYEKCGFRLEATLKNDIYRDGRMHDSHAMGILKSEWETLYRL